MELGKYQILVVDREKEFGVYLKDKATEESVLLPRKQVPKGTKVGDELELFIYKDSNDRLIATLKKPLITLNETAVLTVADVNKNGAFLDWGLEKDLFLPFKEQEYPVKKGDRVIVALYADKSSRLAATMKVYPYLNTDAKYANGEKVWGTVYRISSEVGVFIAIENRHYGFIPKQNVFRTFKVGEEVEAYVVRTRDDGKVDLSTVQKAYIQMKDDSDAIMSVIDKNGGVLPFTEKVSPEVIKKEFHMSKSAFKRALGNLFKEEKIIITSKAIKKAQKKSE